jgi:hypothetical protein
MVIGIIPDASTAESFLNNLSEAEFKLKNVSVILRDLKTRNAIAKDTGPFKGVTLNSLSGKLTQLGLSSQDAQPYVDAVTNGKALVAVLSPKGAEQAAAEMFKDASGELIRTV